MWSSRHIIVWTTIFAGIFAFLFYRYCRPGDLAINVVSVLVLPSEGSFHTSVDNFLSGVVRGSLPSFLWTFLWGNATQWIWFDELKSWKFMPFEKKGGLLFWLALPFSMCVCWEFLQKSGTLPGTCDGMDILFGLFGSVAAWSQTGMILSREIIQGEPK